MPDLRALPPKGRDLPEARVVKARVYKGAFGWEFTHECRSGVDGSPWRGYPTGTHRVALQLALIHVDWCR